jgi:hypothetical protein
LPQAFLWSGSGCLGRRLGREEVGEDIRSRRSRESCDKKERGEPEPQVTGHGIPRFTPRPRTTFGADLGRNAAQIWRPRGFVLARNTAAAKGMLLLPVNDGMRDNGLVELATFRLCAKVSRFGYGGYRDTGTTAYTHIGYRGLRGRYVRAGYGGAMHRGRMRRR